jgi:hypothetical protein
MLGDYRSGKGRFPQVVERRCIRRTAAIRLARLHGYTSYQLLCWLLAPSCEDLIGWRPNMAIVACGGAAIQITMDNTQFH